VLDWRKRRRRHLSCFRFYFRSIQQLSRHGGWVQLAAPVLICGPTTTSIRTTAVHWEFQPLWLSVRAVLCCGCAYRVVVLSVYACCFRQGDDQTFNIHTR